MRDSILGLIMMVVTYFVADAILKSTVNRKNEDGTLKTERQIKEEAYAKTGDDSNCGCWFIVLIIVIAMVVATMLKHSTKF